MLRGFICLAGILPDCSVLLDPELIEDKIAGMITLDTVRIFFALWPTDDECRALLGWQTVLQPLCGGRAMRADTLHATLLFIGTVEVARLEALKLTAEEVRAQRFELCFDAARYWEHNRIVYAAPCVIPEPLLQLVDELERHAIAHEFRFEQREYQPHVTLLRNAHNGLLPEMQPVNWSVREFVLVQSHEGNYKTLVRFPLQ